jgi:hypothetical protein
MCTRDEDAQKIAAALNADVQNIDLSRRKGATPMTIEPPTPYTGPLTQAIVDAAFPRRAQSLGSLLQGVPLTLMDYADNSTSVQVGPCDLDTAMAIIDALRAARKEAANGKDDAQ